MSRKFYSIDFKLRAVTVMEAQIYLFPILASDCLSYKCQSRVNASLELDARDVKGSGHETTVEHCTHSCQPPKKNFLDRKPHPLDHTLFLVTISFTEAKKKYYVYAFWSVCMY